MRIAITGGMGCGKTRVLNAISDVLCDTYAIESYDSEVHRLYEQDEDFKAELRREFGTSVRLAVGPKVFWDREAMNRLIEISDPYMRRYMERATARENVVMEVPMLFEIPYARDMFDIAIAVWCDEKTQRERILRRDMCSEEIMERKLSFQLSADEKAKRSDYVIDTSDGAVDVREQLEVVLRVASLDHP